MSTWMRCLILLMIGAASAVCLGGAAELPAKSPGTLRVMQLNIWQEGTQVPGGFDKLADIIDASDADIVALSEVRNYKKTDLHQRLVEALAAKGKTYFGQYVPQTDAGLITRLPLKASALVDTHLATDNGSMAGYRLELPGGRMLFVCSAHLDYRHYGAYEPRGYGANSFKLIDADGDGQPDAAKDAAHVLSEDRKSKRRESIGAFLAYLKANKLTDQPVLLMGDFNEASHLDWTEGTRDLFDHHGLVVPWDCSRMLAEAGFGDAWRVMYPNPATHPGMTWPSTVCSGKKTTWTPLADERDRVDYVYFNKVGLRVKSAWLVGPVTYWVRDKVMASEGEDAFVMPERDWPTDHKGVLVDFLVGE